MALRLAASSCSRQTMVSHHLKEKFIGTYTHTRTNVSLHRQEDLLQSSRLICSHDNNPYHFLFDTNRQKKRETTIIISGRCLMVKCVSRTFFFFIELSCCCKRCENDAKTMHDHMFGQLTICRPDNISNNDDDDDFISFNQDFHILASIKARLGKRWMVIKLD